MRSYIYLQIKSYNFLSVWKHSFCNFYDSIGKSYAFERNHCATSPSLAFFLLEPSERRLEVNNKPLRSLPQKYNQRNSNSSLAVSLVIFW